MKKTSAKLSGSAGVPPAGPGILPGSKVTLEVLDAMPATPPVALADLTVDQLADAVKGLDAAEENYTNLSGICATMKGLLLIETKARLEHGAWQPWMKANLPSSQKTATKYMRLAEQFSKTEPRFSFDNLRLELVNTLQASQGSQLDLSNPIVGKVADWVKGRSSYQLLLDFSKPKKGGKTYEREDGKGDRKDTPEDAALEAWGMIQRHLLIEGINDKTWAHLPDKGEVSRESISGILIGLGKMLREASPLGPATSESPRIDPSEKARAKAALQERWSKK